MVDTNAYRRALGFVFEPMPLVGLVVSDLDATIEQYARLFGLEFIVFNAGVDYSLSYDTAAAGDTAPPLPAQARIGFDTANHFELMEMPGVPEGLRNVHYRVDDMDAAVAHLVAEGLTPAQVIQVGDAKEVVFDATELSGLRLVLVEYEGDSFARALESSPRPA